MNQQVDDFNCIIRYLARRDLPELTSDALLRHRGAAQADLMILMGGVTTPDFATVAAKAYVDGLARRLFVVGGSRHSTQNLRENVGTHPSYGSIRTDGRAEAEILCDIMVESFDIEPRDILVERYSTNCGNNATLALEVMRQTNAASGSAIIIQDPIMQRRTLESFRQKWRGEQTVFDAFAPAVPLLALRPEGIGFADSTHDGYYRMKGFLELVMGEIPRLRDDEDGYGPRGLGFIGHVEIPKDVLVAFSRLLPLYAQHIRPKHKS